MVALVEAARRTNPAHEVVLVISNVPDAPALGHARARDVEALALDHRPFGKDREAHEQAIDAELRARGVEVVALAGYMRILTPWLVGRWKGRMLNVHPSLLPKYPGLDTHARALAAGDPEAGCTIHLVTDGVDEGPILGQTAVPIRPGDTAGSLAERVRTAEHGLYPAVLDRFCRDLLTGREKGPD